MVKGCEINNYNLLKVCLVFGVSICQLQLVDSISFTNIGIKLCQYKCKQYGCRGIRYNIETLTCHLSEKNSEMIMEETGQFFLPSHLPKVRTGICAFDTCEGMRCLETRAGKTACVKGEYNPAQNQTIVYTILIDACTTGDLQQVKYILSQDAANINTRGENGMTPVMIATEKGHREIVELLVKKGSDLSLFDEDANNILHLACKEGNVEIVKYIHSQKIIDIESRGKNENTPLMFAVQFGNMEVFSFLMKKGANISNVDKDGGNILHLSCRRGNEEIVNYILKRNLVDINSEMDDGMTPLLLTAKLGKKKLFQLLIERGAYGAKTPDRKELLKYACEGGDVEIMKRVLNLTNVDINTELWDGITPLLRVAFLGNSELFKFLVTKGADVTIVDDNKENVLHSGCRGGNVEIVKYVLKHNLVDINGKQHKGMTPVFLAAFWGFQAVFEYLVEKGADLSGVDADGDNILHLACRGENVEIVKYVLTQNIVDINSKGVDGMTPVLLAAFLGYRAVFEYLVEKGADLSGVDADGNNILHLACRGDNVEMVKYVLKHNLVDINGKQDKGMTPVFLAAFWGFQAVFEYLVEKGADLSGVDADGDNILHLACRGKNVEIVKYVLTQNIVDINSKGFDGMTPVLLAAFLGYRAVFEYLVEKGADLSGVAADGNNILHLACRGDHVEMVKYVLKHNLVDINGKQDKGRTPVFLAARLGFQAVFEYLVEKGADLSGVDADGDNILHLACRGKNVEIVKYVLTQNIVDINSKGFDGMTPVLLAAFLGYRAVFEYLVEKGADLSGVDADGDNILHLACRGDHVEMVKYVLKHNLVDINGKQDKGRTPVFLAAGLGFQAVFEYLVEKGADLSGVDADGDNILHLACRGENVEIVKYVLTQNIVDINSKGFDGMTPVLVAAFLGYRAVFEYLVEKGADLSGVDADGDNILHLACRGGNVEIVKCVLTKNIVDINSKGVDGMTPVLVAAFLGYRAVFEYLVEKGADLSGVDADGNNILHLASCGGNVEIVKYVLTKNIVDINTKGNNEMTSVMLAATLETREVFQLLTERGADLSVVNTDGDNVLHLACRAGNEDIVKYVLSHGMEDITITNKQGLNATMVARGKGNLSITELLSQVSQLM